MAGGNPIIFAPVVVAPTGSAEWIMGPQVVQTLGAMLSTAGQQPHAIAYAADENVYSGELDEAKAELDTEPRTATFLLKRIRERAWDRLTPRHRFRWYTLSAEAATRQEKDEEAARLLLEAKACQPDDEMATVNEAVAYELLHDHSKAHDLALVARSRFPNSARAHAVCLRTAPSVDRLLALLGEIPEPLKNHPDVLVSAIAREDLARDSTTFEIWARRAVAAAPTDPRAYFFLGLHILNSEYASVDSELPPSNKVPDIRRIEEAREHLTKALELSDRAGMRRFRLNVLLRRAQAASQLGDAARMQDDIEAARRQGPTEPAVLAAYAQMLPNKGNYDQAIQVLRQARTSSVDVNTGLLLGVNLWNRNAPGDRDEATALLAQVAEHSERHADTAAEFAIQSLITLKRYESAEACLTSIKSRIDPVLFATLSSDLAVAKGDTETGNCYASEAIKKTSAQTLCISLKCLTKTLVSLGRLTDALPLLARLAIPEIANDDAYRFVECAWRLEQHGKILTFCKAAREANVFDERLLEWELSVLDHYEPDVALDLLFKLAEKRPGNRRVKLHIVMLALRVGQIELAVLYAGDLPTVTEANAPEGEAVVSVLIELERFAEAAKYAYDLLRRHFHDHHAHRAFWHAIVFGERDADVVVTAPEVASGTAVGITEDGSSDMRWFVLEDSPVQATGVTNELTVNSPLAQKLIGKRVSDRVAISDGVGLARWITVCDIVPKQVFRFRDVLEQWQIRFPERQELWMVRMPSTESGEPDVSSMIEMMKDRKEHWRRMEEIYTKNPVSIHVFARAVNVGEFEVVHHIAYTDGLTIKCSPATHEEWSKAESAFRSALEIVVAPTALATLSLLEDFELLKDVGKSLIISRSTMIMLRGLLKKMRTSQRAAASPRASKEQPVPAERDAGVEALERFVRMVETNCQPLGCTALAHLEPDERKRLVEAVGTCEAESMLLATANSRVLWTDDFVTTVFGRERFRVQRVWTQSLFQFASSAGLIEQARHDRASAKLLGFGYEFTGVNPEIMRVAGELAQWGNGKWPLKQALDYLAMQALRMEDAVRLGASLIAAACRTLGRRELKRTLLIETAERLAKRADGLSAVQMLGKVLPRAFSSVDVINQLEATRMFITWQNEYARRVVIVGGK